MIQPKIDIICVAPVVRLISPFALFQYALRDFSLSALEQSPPVPPPRVMAAWFAGSAAPCLCTGRNITPLRARDSRAQIAIARMFSFFGEENENLIASSLRITQRGGCYDSRRVHCYTC